MLCCVVLDVLGKDKNRDGFKKMLLGVCVVCVKMLLDCV